MFTEWRIVKEGEPITHWQTGEIPISIKLALLDSCQIEERAKSETVEVNRHALSVLWESYISHNKVLALDPISIAIQDSLYFS